jgi:nitrogen regulatory protein P-II 2
MALTVRKLLTIVVESSLERNIIKDLKALGIKGYTLAPCVGEGSSGLRSGDWDQNKNIMVSIICPEDVAQKAVVFLHDTYSENYAMISYISDVQVHRDSKF